MASKAVSHWAALLAVPTAIGLGLPIGLTVGREFGGGDRILRILYGGGAGVVVALAVAGVLMFLARRSGKDAEPNGAPDPARNKASGSP